MERMPPGCVPVPRTPPPAWRTRSELELMAQQVQAIDRFNRARRLREQTLAATARTRELRMDASRSLAVLRREHAALIARSHEQLRASGAVLTGQAQRRVVLAHRSAWFLGAVERELLGTDVAVVARLDNGADVIGLVVAEQPDLVLVEDALAMARADDVLRAAREFAPDTLVGVQGVENGRAGPLLEAGAVAVFDRRVRPREVAGRLLELLCA